MRPSRLGQACSPVPAQASLPADVPRPPAAHGLLPEVREACRALPPPQDCRGIKCPGSIIEPIPLVLDPFEEESNPGRPPSPIVFLWKLPQPHEHFPLRPPTEFIDPEEHDPEAELSAASLEAPGQDEPAYLSSGDEDMPDYDPYSGKRKRSAKKPLRPFHRHLSDRGHGDTSSEEEYHCNNPRCGSACGARPKSSSSHYSIKSCHGSRPHGSRSSSFMDY